MSLIELVEGSAEAPKKGKKTKKSTTEKKPTSAKKTKK
jgi:hypothetical protein